MTEAADGDESPNAKKDTSPFDPESRFPRSGGGRHDINDLQKSQPLILSSVSSLRCPEGFKTYMKASYSSSMQPCKKKKSSALVHLRTIRITFTISKSKSSSNVSPTHSKAAQGNVVGLCCDCYRDRAKPASPIVANMMISKTRIVCEIYYKTNQIAGPHRRSYIRWSSLTYR